MRQNFALCAGLSVLFLGIALAQSTDPLIGTWQLNRGKSEFDPPSTMMSRTLRFEEKAGALSVVQQTVTQNGATVEIEYTASYDNKDVPISNSPLDTVAHRRVSADVVERTGKIRGAVTETAVMTLSRDRKTLTIITKGSTNGVAYSNNQVFERR
jgi:hypothetical protein